MKKKRKIKIIPYIFLTLTLAVVVITIASSRWLKVYEHVVYIENLPLHLEGFRILQISDLHSNSPYRMNLNIWRHIDNLNFDMAAITGDIVLDGSWLSRQYMRYLDPHKPHLQALADRVPTFFVEGNHEARTINIFKDIMADLGINFLFNETYFLPINGGYLEIIGTRDYSVMRRASFEPMDALFDAPSPFRLILTHNPQAFDRFKDAGPLLAIAGHSHGGQIRIPFFPTLYSPGQGIFPEYGDGFYYHNDAVLYVSRGVGTTHFPLRFWNRPEIAIFELRRK